MTRLIGACRVVVLSPHADDAALSVGALIAQSARRGVRIDVVTVFAGEAESMAPAGDWDAWSGFLTAGEAARARRAEDLSACAVLGATCVQLPFPDDQYERRADDATVSQAIAECVSGADVVLAPGFPLLHPDHARLVRMVLRSDFVSGRIALYVELPYAVSVLSRGGSPKVPDTLGDLITTDVEFRSVRSGTRARLTKWRALRCYRSQIGRLGRLLGGGSSTPWRLLVAERRVGGEALAWLPTSER